jgi:hypothetical protein
MRQIVYQLRGQNAELPCHSKHEKDMPYLDISERATYPSIVCACITPSNTLYSMS